MEKAPGFSPGASHALSNYRQYIRGRTITSAAVAAFAGACRGRRDRLISMWERAPETARGASAE